MSLEESYRGEKIQIRIADLDFYGHVGNAVYLSFFESAHVTYFSKRHLFLLSGYRRPPRAQRGHVHAASLHDRDGSRELLTDELQGELPRLAVVWADAAYTSQFREWVGQELGCRVEVPRHPDRQLWRYGLEEKPRGFRVLPRRWVGHCSPVPAASKWLPRSWRGRGLS